MTPSVRSEAAHAHYVAAACAQTSAPWGNTLVRGMLCNWLVCLGVWQATAAQDIIGKIVSIFCAPHTPPVRQFELWMAVCLAGWGQQHTADCEHICEPWLNHV